MEHAAAIWSRYPPARARRRVRLRVDSDAEVRPSSARTRSTSSRLAGSTTRAIARSRKTSSPTASSNPKLAYTPASAPYSRPLLLLSTCGRTTNCRGIGWSGNNVWPGGATIWARTVFGVMPRSNSPWLSSANSRRASSLSRPSSASSRAEPKWRTIRRRPSTDSAIWTAVAPRGGAHPPNPDHPGSLPTQISA